MKTEKPSFKQLIYRTKDGKADYRFLFTNHPSEGWRAYIRDQPLYGNCSDSLHATLRIWDNGYHYISTNIPIRTLEEMKQLAAKWAEFTQEYIRKGNKKLRTRIPFIGTTKKSLQNLAHLMRRVPLNKTRKGKEKHMKKVTTNIRKGCDEVPTGSFSGGKDTIPDGTFHGGDSVPDGTFHA